MSNREFGLLQFVITFVIMFVGFIISSLCFVDPTEPIIVTILLTLFTLFITDMFLKDKLVTEVKHSKIAKKIEKNFIAK